MATADAALRARRKELGMESDDDHPPQPQQQQQQQWQQQRPLPPAPLPSNLIMGAGTGNRHQQQQPLPGGYTAPPGGQSGARSDLSASVGAAAASVPPQRRVVNTFKGETVGEWHKGAFIGRGATGSVFEAIDNATEGVFCVKEIVFDESFADSPEELKRFENLTREVALLRDLQHPNVVRFLGIAKIGFTMYIMMEFITGGSIQQVVQQFGALREDLAARYTRQIVDGLLYMHDKNIIHRDIKGANILVGDDGVVRLADFGAAKEVVPDRLQHTLAGTPYWMAPEVVRQEGHGKPADVWSLGATALQMLTGLAPFQNLNSMSALFKIGQGKECPVPTDLNVSADAIDFLQRCFVRDPTMRPTVHELQHHPWIVNANKPQHSSSMQSPQGSNNIQAAATAVTSNNGSSSNSVSTYNDNEIMDFVIEMSHHHGVSQQQAANGGADAAQTMVMQQQPQMPPPQVPEEEEKPFDPNEFQKFVASLTQKE